jgi:hypothetical protein
MYRPHHRGFNVERQQTTILNPTLRIFFPSYSCPGFERNVDPTVGRESVNEDEKHTEAPRLIYYSLYVGMAIKTCDLIQHHWKQASSELRNIEKVFLYFVYTARKKWIDTGEKRGEKSFTFLQTQLNSLNSDNGV